jgi:hypothetical protein
MVPWVFALSQLGGDFEMVAWFVGFGHSSHSCRSESGQNRFGIKAVKISDSTCREHDADVHRDDSSAPYANRMTRYTRGLPADPL